MQISWFPVGAERSLLLIWQTNIKISSDPAQPLPYRFVGLEFTIFRPCHTCITCEKGNHELRFELNVPQLVCASVVTVFYALIMKCGAWIRHLAVCALAWGRPTANQNAANKLTDQSECNLQMTYILDLYSIFLTCKTRERSRDGMAKSGRKWGRRLHCEFSIAQPDWCGALKAMNCGLWNRWRVLQELQKIWRYMTQ